MSQQYDNLNKGVLFKNDDKRDDRDPDYRGQLNVNGQEFWLDSWINEAKKDKRKYMSIRIKPKQAAEHKGGTANPPAQRSAGEDFNDDIPF